MIGPRLGKWIIDREIGRGGMGQVFLAHDDAGGPAALKVLAAELAVDSGFLARFEREIDVLGQLNHPNIVRFYESGVENGVYFYAMEYVDGVSFDDLLRERGRIPWPEVLDAALQICPALKHAHDRGIVHRDLKPPNLLRTSAGVIKLTDFGIAKVFAGRQLTTTGGVVGTAEFLSPEQAAGKPATKRSDIYSFGVVLYTLLTGRTPFEGDGVAELLHKHLYAQFDRPQKLVPEIPHDLDAIICRCLEKDPDKRPGDALFLHRDFDRLRRKMERKEQQTVVTEAPSGTLAENREESEDNDGPGPATLMSNLVREELLRQNAGGPVSQFINRPPVLVVLFLLCVAGIAWALWPRPEANPEAQFQEGSRLMQSSDPSDWLRGWREYLQPLADKHPENVHAAEIEEYRTQAEGLADLRRAFLRKGKPVTSEAQRFFQLGLRQYNQGDWDRARRTWQGLVSSFHDIPRDRSWVVLAEQGLRRLTENLPEIERPGSSLDEALARARQLAKDGKQAEAKDIWDGLEMLYVQDPGAADVVKRIETERMR